MNNGKFRPFCKPEPTEEEDPSRDGFISSSSEILKEQIGSKRPRYELTSKTSPQHGGHQSNEVPTSSKVPNDDGIVQSKKLRTDSPQQGGHQPNKVPIHESKTKIEQSSKDPQNDCIKSISSRLFRKMEQESRDLFGQLELALEQLQTKEVENAKMLEKKNAEIHSLKIELHEAKKEMKKMMEENSKIVKHHEAKICEKEEIISAKDEAICKLMEIQSIDHKLIELQQRSISVMKSNQEKANNDTPGTKDSVASSSRPPGTNLKHESSANNLSRPNDDGTHDAPEEQKPNKFLVGGAVLLKQILEERVCESTKKKYSAIWTRWTEMCRVCNIDPFTSNHVLLNIGLALEFNRTKSVSSTKQLLNAISHYYRKNLKSPPSDDKNVQIFIHGLIKND